MKVEKISNDDFRIYIYFSAIQTDNVYEDVKCFLKKFQKKWKLDGFYLVSVCLKKYGSFLILHRVDDSYYRGTFDLKIILENMDIYFKTTDYFLFSTCCSAYYHKGFYYFLMDDIVDEILPKIEFGSFVFGEEISDIIGKSYII